VRGSSETADAAETGLLLSFRLHPWCIGQPYRIKYLEEIVAYMRAREGVWLATGSDIIEWYRKQPHATRVPTRGIATS
jgi:hypothetical protein